jgi:hypothetical protein
VKPYFKHAERVEHAFKILQLPVRLFSCHISSTGSSCV